MATVELLSSHHGTSLLNLDIGAYRATPGRPDGTMNALQALSVKSIMMSVDRDPQPLIASILARNRLTLRHLDLGAEINVFNNNGRDYQDARPQFSVASKLRIQVEHELKTSPQPVYFPNVDRIRLRGLNVPALFSGQGYKLIDFSVLSSLTLESCNPMSTAFEFLATLTLSRLRFFHLRIEGVGPDGVGGLETFLCGLLPLEALSILLDGILAPTGIRLGTILRIHGQSLQTFLIDVRRRRLFFIHDSRRSWQNQCVMDLCEFCPNLVELGIPSEWCYTPGEIISLTKVREAIISFLVKSLILT